MTSPGNKVAVKTLGACEYPSPLPYSAHRGDGVGNFVCEDTWIPYEIEEGPQSAGTDTPRFEKAGPREKLFFDPKDVKAAIVTCGGLCPGLNNVIRSVFLSLHYNYHVPEVLGIRYGYRGLNPANGHEPVRLTPDLVEAIDEQGGSVLGISRGSEEASTMVDFLEREGINILFCAGGDGTLRGAHRIHEEVARRGARIAVVGIPKTIDNDVPYCSRTFGFTTAIEMARDVLRLAHNEARSALNGIGLVKVMGRDAGFIAAGATLSSQDVNFTLVPEVPIELEGEHGFLRALRKRIETRHHAVVVVAEGAGQSLFEAARREHDASGNPRYNDIGLFLKAEIGDYLKSRGIPFDLKYIDPSYIIRSVPANSEDCFLTDQFGRRAVHAAMAGRTDVSIGFANASFFHVPLTMITSTKKRIETEDEMWMSVLAATGQPRSFTRTEAG